MKTVLAIDPGSGKCGIAIVTSDGVLHRDVISRGTAPQTVIALIAQYSIDEVIIGNGTGCKQFIEEMRRSISDIHITAVNEAFTSQKARARFIQDNPPRGIRRLIPRGLLSPDRPYDDYVALILAEEYLKTDTTGR